MFSQRYKKGVVKTVAPNGASNGNGKLKILLINSARTGPKQPVHEDVLCTLKKGRSAGQLSGRCERAEAGIAGDGADSTDRQLARLAFGSVFGPVGDAANSVIVSGRLAA
jgi:hypothetical protein